MTLANPTAGTYAVSVRACVIPGDTYPDAGYTLRVHLLAPFALNFASSLNAGNGGTNVNTRSIGDGQIVFYRIDVPATLDGKAVLGWRVGFALATGNADWRVARTYPPSAAVDYVDASDTRTLGLTPPFLTPGTWFIQVQGRGLATYTLTSEPVVLRRPAWTMPAPGESVMTSGLPAGGSVFADTGLREDGTPLPDPVLGTVTDQGIDLANADYHYYAVTVPENNAGLLHAELIAINGNPDLYARMGDVPSDNRSETAAILKLEGTGTEYASWVPQETRTQTRLTPGTWYLAVKAGGSTNARYRLRLAHGNPVAGGIVQDLPLNGGNFPGQLLAAGDLRFYRVVVPATAPASWQITYAQTQGDVDLFVRDVAPPGIGGYGWSASYADNVSDWRSDNKNQGPYDYYPNQGTVTLATPPLRPGHVYYLGFRANTDASFSVSSTTTGTVAQPAAIAFYGGRLDNVSVPTGGSITYRIEVPADATRWKHTATNTASVRLFIEEGATVDLTRLSTVSPHAQSSAAANWVFNQSLVSTNSWPWLPGARTFYLTVQNTAATDQTFSIAMDGRNALTEDENNDGIPDAWEIQYFGTIYIDPNGDADSDGSTNLQEYQNGTDPKNASSVKFQLALAGVGATVAANPSPSPCLPGTAVTLTATPNNGLTFLGWAPTAYNAATGYAAAAVTNPLTVTMDANKAFTAYAGLPLADALDTTGLAWATGGSVLWVGQNAITFDGIDAAKVTGLPAYGAEAWIETTVAAPGTCSWRWKLAEAQNGNSRVDFYEGTSLIRTLYSTTDWTQESYTVSGTGTRALRWRIYRETNDAAAAQDAAYLDTVSYTSFSAPSALAATNVTATNFTANWNTVADATGYTLEVSPAENFSTGLATYSPGNMIAYPVTDRQSATTYYYRVRAERGVDTSPNSNVIAVTTLAQLAAPTITTQPSNQSVSVGGEASFNVTASGNPAPSSYQWQRQAAGTTGFVNLTDGGNISGATTATLTISNAQPADAGSYTVVVTNTVGSETSDPAVLAIAHSADADRDFRIGLIELTRVIELYNTRNGATRTGRYKVLAGSEDGFAQDTTAIANQTLARYHSADSNRNGQITLNELTRAIELYNTRAGTTRTGQYHVQVGTEDGFAPGP